MTWSELVVYTFVGLVAVVALVGIIRLLFGLFMPKTDNNAPIVCVGKLTNGDSSIGDAMENLQLTNGIESYNFIPTLKKERKA